MAGQQEACFDTGGDDEQDDIGEFAMLSESDMCGPEGGDAHVGWRCDEERNPTQCPAPDTAPRWKESQESQTDAATGFDSVQSKQVQPGRWPDLE